MLWTTIKNIFKDKTCIFSWHFFLKTTILKWETNKLELNNKNQNTIIKTKQTMFEYKSMLLSVFCLKTTILKWETNKLELKNKNQYTIIKAKQTMFENKNMLFSIFFV